MNGLLHFFNVEGNGLDMESRDWANPSKTHSRTNELAKENIKANQNVKSNLIIEALLTCLSNSKNTFAHSEIKAGKGF